MYTIKSKNGRIICQTVSEYIAQTWSAAGFVVVYCPPTLAAK